MQRGHGEDYMNPFVKKFQPSLWVDPDLEEEEDSMSNSSSDSVEEEDEVVAPRRRKSPSKRSSKRQRLDPEEANRRRRAATAARAEARRIQDKQLLLANKIKYERTVNQCMSRHVQGQGQGQGQSQALMEMEKETETETLESTSANDERTVLTCSVCLGQGPKPRIRQIQTKISGISETPINDTESSTTELHSDPTTTNPTTNTTSTTTTTTITTNNNNTTHSTVQVKNKPDDNLYVLTCVTCLATIHQGEF